MKRYILGLAVSSMALVSMSCSDFLNTEPEGNPSTETYFTNDQQAIDAIDALYFELGCRDDDWFARDFFWEQAGACDIALGRTANADRTALGTLDYYGDISPLRNVWNTVNKVIARANWVVYKLLEKEKGTALTDIEKRSLGEAYFMRAFSHFYSAYRYGTDKQGVPFCRWEDYEGGYDNSIPPQQATVMVNYQMIIEDFEKAKSYLPKFEEYSADDRGRAHKAACVGYEAKTYAYWAAWDESKWQNVISCVNDLETTYGRGLADTFAQVFSGEYEDFWTREYLWTVPSDGGSHRGGSEFPGIIVENNGWGIYNGWGQFKPTLDIYEEMAKDGAGNDRLVRSILEYNQEFQFNGEMRRFYSASDVETGFMINKYLDPFKHPGIDDGTSEYVSHDSNNPTARMNLPILRFADCLLLRAEAYILTGNAAAATVDINRVRTRSNLTPLSGEATGKDLYHERRCELAFEFSDHLYDLKRWNRSSNAEIKALADAELAAHPRVRNYEDRSDPTSSWTEGSYADYPNKTAYQSYKIVYPYPSAEITKAGGLLKQNEGY